MFEIGYIQLIAHVHDAVEKIKQKQRVKQTEGTEMDTFTEREITTYIKASFL